jgi:hypothetical protein
MGIIVFGVQSGAINDSSIFHICISNKPGFQGSSIFGGFNIRVFFGLFRRKFGTGGLDIVRY